LVGVGKLFIKVVSEAYSRVSCANDHNIAPLRQLWRSSEVIKPMELSAPERLCGVFDW
jgi:hypothetical protein